MQEIDKKSVKFFLCLISLAPRSLFFIPLVALYIRYRKVERITFKYRIFYLIFHIMKDICEVVSDLNPKEIYEMLKFLSENRDNIEKSIEDLTRDCGNLATSQEMSDSGLLKMMLFKRTNKFLDIVLSFFSEIFSRPLFLRSDKLKMMKNLVLHKIAIETFYYGELTNVALLLKEILMSKRSEDFFYTVYQQLDTLFSSVENLMNKIMNEKDLLIEFDMFMRHFERDGKNSSYLLYEVHRNLSELLLEK